MVLVFDVTQRATFAKLDDWVREIRANAPLHSKMILIGNKSDLEEERQISPEEGKAFATRHDMFYWETSAKLNTGQFVHQAFGEIIEECKKMILEQETADMSRELENIRKKTVTIKKSKGKKDGPCC